MLYIIELVTDVHVLISELFSSSIHICYVLMFGIASYMLYCYIYQYYIHKSCKYAGAL
jgi:hypothetical protein